MEANTKHTFQRGASQEFLRSSVRPVFTKRSANQVIEEFHNLRPKVPVKNSFFPKKVTLSPEFVNAFNKEKLRLSQQGLSDKKISQLVYYSLLRS